MANKKATKKTVAKTKKSTVSKKPAAKRKIIDPMMVSPRKARKDERTLANTAIENEVDFEVKDEEEDNDDTFLSEESLYSIDDLSRKDHRKTDKKVTPMKEKKEVELDKSEHEKTREELRKERAEAEKRRKKAGKKAKTKTPLWAKILIAFLILIIAALGVAGWYFFNIYSAASGVLEGNPMDALINKKPLAKDEQGRTNILIFGTAEDDEGHGGAMLTDSILVVSLDQDRKIASTFSVPRDLWVNYTVAGEKALSCSVGYKGKINATYYCAQRANDNSKEEGSKYFAKKIMEITGIDIQYYVAVDFSVLRDVVNTLGGIDVDVHATDDRGILDYCMNNLKLNKGMNYNLDGETVLRLARARNAKGGYGLANSNFDREINQQRIINAIKDKALNVGILLDLNKVKSMLASFGENVKTNITWAEMGTAIDVATGLHGDVESIDTRPLFGTGRIGNQSVVIPKGANVDSDYSLYNYNKIQLYLREQLDQDTKDYDKSLEQPAEEENKEENK
ncbi:LCP family protein [Candidatus Saccharibacteria bacterium]|nr:LCP family protein [Candidatus Saccharibacteria bacterium]